MPLVRVGRSGSGKLLFLPPGFIARKRENKTLSLSAPDGRPYGICVQCSDRASLESLAPHQNWKCVSCGFVDCDTCPGGRHDLMAS